MKIVFVKSIHYKFGFLLIKIDIIFAYFGTIYVKLQTIL